MVVQILAVVDGSALDFANGLVDLVNGMLFFIINALFESSRGAILGVIGFFVVGGLLLWMVDVDEGQRQAQAGETSVPG